MVPRCPTCANPGQTVKRATLESLVRCLRNADIGNGAYHVCLTPDCETVYFGAGGATFEKSDLSVRFGLKETDAPRPICYCFDHSIEDIDAEIRRTSRSTVLASIKAAMSGPGCRCEQLNPLGGCCLKTVQAAVTRAFERAGHENTPPARSSHSGRRAAEAGTMKYGRTGAIAAGGSMLAAILSSACCWLPLVLIAFGATAAGVAGFFEAYRSTFIAGAVVMLGFGFYSVYSRQGTCSADAACSHSSQRQRALSRVMLWSATAFVGAFVFFPNYVGYLLAAPTTASAPATKGRLLIAKFRIDGMSCEGCAETLRTALGDVPGVQSVEVDYRAGTAEVRFSSDRPVSTQQVIAVVKGAGYTASFSDG